MCSYLCHDTSPDIAAGAIKAGQSPPALRASSLGRLSKSTPLSQVKSFLLSALIIIIATIFLLCEDCESSWGSGEPSLTISDVLRTLNRRQPMKAPWGVLYSLCLKGHESTIVLFIWVQSSQLILSV